MNKQLITSADEYARQAEEHEADGMEWSTMVPVDPSIWHDVLDRYPDLDNVVVDHEELPDDVVERLARWPWEFIRWQLTLRDNLPASVADALQRDIEPTVRNGMARWQGISLDELAALNAGRTSVPTWDEVSRALKERYGVHWRDVSRRDIPVRLAPYDNPNDLKLLLKKLGFSDLDPGLPLANDEWMRAICQSGEIASWISFAGKTPIPVLTELAAHGCRHCRETVAKSPDTSRRVLAALSVDTMLEVRDAVAKNQNADIPSLLLLASDDHEWIRDNARSALDQRYGVLLDPLQTVLVPMPGNWQPIASVSELLSLWNTADPASQVHARFGRLKQRVQDSKRLRSANPLLFVRNQTSADHRLIDYCLEQVAGERAKHGCEICHIDDLSLLGRAALATTLAHHQEISLRCKAAQSLNTPLNVLESLSEEPVTRIAESARRTLRVLSGWRERDSDWHGKFDSPAEILSTIRDSRAWVRRGFSQMNAPQQYWREILAQAPELSKWVAINETVGPRLLDELADWPDPEVRKWVSDHPRAWLKTLTRLALDSDPAVRRRAIYNSRLSNQTLARLREDTDPEVAAEASRRLAARAYVDRLLNDPEWWRHLGNSEIV